VRLLIVPLSFLAFGLTAAWAFGERWQVPESLDEAVSGPAEWVVVLAGLSRMPARRVVLAIAIGAFPAGFSMAALGALAVDRPLLALAITVAVAAAVLWLGRRLVHGPTGAPQA
jgi:hypothetical protein